MINILWLFLPGILALGAITSYEDIKYGKIKNKWIILSLVYTILIYIGIIGYSLQSGINTRYLIELGTNLLFAIIVGFGFYLAKIWTAGDGKLFIAYSSLVPLSAYVFGRQDWVPSLTLLINIFVISAMIIIGLVLYKAKLDDLRHAFSLFIKDFFSLKKILSSIIYLFSIYWIVQILLSLIGLGNNYILTIGVTVLCYALIRKKLGKNILYLMLGLACLRFIIDKSVYSWQFLINFLIIVFVWRLFRSFFIAGIPKLGQKVFSKNKTTPFAPFMFLGTLLTLFIRGSVIVFVRYIIVTFI